MTQALLPTHPSVYPSIWFAFVWMSLILQLLQPQFLHYPSPQAAVASWGLRQQKFPGHEVETCWSRLAHELSLSKRHWTGSGVGVNLEGTGHVVLCGSNGLITEVIKWAKLDRPGFGMKYTRLWFLCSFGWDSNWQSMAGDGIRAEENVPPSNLGSDPLVRGKNLARWLITLSLDVGGLGMRHTVTVLTEHALGNDAVAHRSSPFPNGVDRPLCGGQERRLSLRRIEATTLNTRGKRHWVWWSVSEMTDGGSLRNLWFCVVWCYSLAFAA